MKEFVITNDYIFNQLFLKIGDLAFIIILITYLIISYMNYNITNEKIITFTKLVRLGLDTNINNYNLFRPYSYTFILFGIIYFINNELSNLLFYYILYTKGNNSYWIIYLIIINNLTLIFFILSLSTISIGNILHQIPVALFLIFISTFRNYIIITNWNSITFKYKLIRFILEIISLTFILYGLYNNNSYELSIGIGQNILFLIYFLDRRQIFQKLKNNL